MDKKNDYVLYIIIGVLFALFMPPIIKQGMFMDGLLYSTVAHNLANGIGTFWEPSFSETHHKFFHEQPPLTFGINALFFRLLGHSIYIEKLYALVLFLLQILFIKLIWNKLNNKKSAENVSSLPILLWCILPVVNFCVINNMEENTMGVFVMASIYFFIRSTQNSIFNTILMGIAVLLSFLCKGFPGLYTLSFGFIYFIFNKEYSFKKMMWHYIYLISTITVLVGLLYFIPVSHNSLGTYLNNRVLNSIKNVSNTDSRFYIVGVMFQQLLLSAAVAGLISYFGKIKKENFQEQKSWLLTFLIAGFCGVIPIMITLEQRFFYLETAMICFILSMSLAVKDSSIRLLQILYSKISKPYWLIIISCLVLINFSLVLYSIGNYNRSAQILPDVNTMKIVFTKPQIIGMHPQHREDFELQYYFQRLYYCAVDAHEKWDTYDYVITDKADATQFLSTHTNYTALNLPLNTLSLFKKQ